VRFAIVRSLFNADITSKLLSGAERGFAAAGISSSKVETFEVPGSFELPLAAKWLAESAKYDAIVCLGCVIRGETAHFEYVAGVAARGIAQVSLETGVPVIFGVLTTETHEQALERAAEVSSGAAPHSNDRKAASRDGGDSKASNKGYEAAESALRMAALRNSLKSKI
jgi:6,7-dimethyl-8-ribityllumazine synthase